MIFDKQTGIWKEQIAQDSVLTQSVVKADVSQEETEEPEETTVEPLRDETEKKVTGSCILSIRFRNHGEYLKWKSYVGGRQWEYLVNYPAVMRAEYVFRNSLEVEMLAKKVVQLLQMGFDVHSAGWKLEEKMEEEK